VPNFGVFFSIVSLFDTRLIRSHITKHFVPDVDDAQDFFRFHPGVPPLFYKLSTGHGRYYSPKSTCWISIIALDGAGSQVHIP
jgi:hypothetical protein